MFETRKKRRERLLRTPLSPEWLAIVERRVPYYRILPPRDRLELQGLVQVFLAEKHFEGCEGLDITDEIRLTIAAQACILLLRRKTAFYPSLISILVYPRAYVAPMRRRGPGGIVSEGLDTLAGQTWDKGSLVLSWDDVVRGASDIHDGRNVVFHEFAHQLDNEAGVADGAPLLPAPSMYAAWARILGKEYGALVDNIEQDRPTLLDSYAATSPAEFFAVATEFFFEKSVELKTRHPRLYAELKIFYEQDPASLAAAAQQNEADP
ncbi:MAG: zinc-dependent peptidase [Candidatus Eisenbacteria bacterium]|nr:zinc-dependent peptidase [Candidatus Eisenbacteria bacterium]